jgi:hypothetical protein
MRRRRLIQNCAHFRPPCLCLRTPGIRF